MLDNRQEFEDILNAFLKPLFFASKNSFSNLGNLRDLESLYKRLCEKISAMGLSEDCLARIHTIEVLVSGFDKLPISSKKDCIIKSIELVQELKSSLETSDTPLYPSLKDVRDNLKVLSTPIEHINGIDKKLAAKFKKKGLETVSDLLHFLPIRYEDRRHMKTIARLNVGAKEVFTGEILVLGEVFYGRRRVFEMVIRDNTGTIRAKWFNYNSWVMARMFRQGQRLILYGEIKRFAHQKEVIHPETESIGRDDEKDSLNFNAIVPIYSNIEGVHQKRLRRILKDVVDRYSRYAIGTTPCSIQRRFNLLPLKEAIKKVHFPDEDKDMLSRNWRPRKSLIFEELFSMELGLAIKKMKNSQQKGLVFKTDSGLLKRLFDILPFKLTAAQERVLSEIKQDMASPFRMNRLLQGDVGAGKTVVALASALISVDNGCQSAVMAPTEILAEQHYRNLKDILDKLNIKAAFLTGGLSRQLREDILDGIRTGETDIVVGTHAIIQKDVEFKRLGLVIIDEQHRFGVLQRASLREKGSFPDVLVMTATPIPRTLAMTLFGDLDISVIDQLPPNRVPVKTKIFRSRDIGRVYDLIGRELRQGRQAYIVYPLVQESEELDLKDATNMAAHLAKEVFKEYKIDLLHGKMKGAEKDSVMQGFKEKRIDILVTTTVVEVGIDVPNATVMVVEHAERFGLAQLHQLRGRVGRGEAVSTCLLVAYKVGREDTYRRLKVMEETTDGFRIAEEDLKIRGPGDFTGIRQSGIPLLLHADIIKDARILDLTRHEAFKLANNSAFTSSNDFHTAKEIIKSRWKDGIDLAEIG